MDQELDKILVTTDDVPGYEIVAVYGEVFGLIVRARDPALTGYPAVLMF